MATLSVVIPTYKRPRELKRALLSVLAQNWPDIEIVVVDDNPPESETRRATERVIADHPGMIHYVRNERSQGGGGARNTGILAARGEFIAFLDDDDEWLPGKLDKQMALFATLPETVACVDTGFIEINETTGTSRDIRPELRGDIFEDLLVKNKGRAPKLSTLVCRKSALLEVGLFDPELPSRQDLDLYLRLARNYRFEYVDESLARKYVHNAGRISSNHRNKIAGFDLLYKKYLTDLKARPKLHRIYLRQHARWLYRGKRPLRALGKIFKSLFV